MTKNQELTKKVLFVSTLLDAIGPEASLTKEAWKNIAGLDLTSDTGLRTLIKTYLIPELHRSPVTYQEQFLSTLGDLLSISPSALDEIPLYEYPYLEKIQAGQLFSILYEEAALMINSGK